MASVSASHGYNLSVGYTHGYYRELTPDWINWGALLNGRRVPDTAGAFRYLELGCGQGFGLCLQAAAYPRAEFLGVDFSAEHIAHARALAQAAGLTNLRFEQADFTVLAREWPAGYGRFDYAVLHGIVSWISPEVRQALIPLLHAALAPQGLVYNSYNCMPGWLATVPLQHLLRRLNAQQPGAGIEVFRQGVERLEALMDAGAYLGAAQPALRERLNDVKNQPLSYLVHEFLHDHWQTLWFSQMAAEMAGAGLAHAGTATLPENFLPELFNNAPLERIVRSCETPELQQEFIDLTLNQSFRRDLWQSGAAVVADAAVRLDAMRFCAGLELRVGNTEVQTSIAPFKIDADIIVNLVPALAYGARSLRELRALPSLRSKDPRSVLKVMTLLLHAGHLLLAAPQESENSVRAFNHATALRAFKDQLPYRYLAARGTATAIEASELGMALYPRLAADHSVEPEVLARRLAATLVDDTAAAGRTLLRDGKPLETPQARYALAYEMTAPFVRQTLVQWRRLGVI